jgi:alcohol dehydrogenase (NADP+)
MKIGFRNTFGYASRSASAPLGFFEFERRELRPNDVAMEVLYCGVCHTDLHQARNDWGWTMYPIVPGHEIVGRVIDVDGDVVRHRVGNAVAVGCMVDSCQHCDQCRKGEEQLCRDGMTQTCNAHDRVSGATTRGGYAKHLGMGAHGYAAANV